MDLDQVSERQGSSSCSCVGGAVCRELGRVCVATASATPAGKACVHLGCVAWMDGSHTKTNLPKPQLHELGAGTFRQDAIEAMASEKPPLITLSVHVFRYGRVSQLLEQTAMAHDTDGLCTTSQHFTNKAATGHVTWSTYMLHVDEH